MKIPSNFRLHLAALSLCLAAAHVHAFYNPTQGRWLNRDRLGESGGRNLFGYAHNDPNQFMDPDGRLTIRRVSVESRNCDVVGYKWLFSLDDALLYYPQQCSAGYFIQQVSFYIDQVDCCDIRPDPPAKTFRARFWEAFGPVDFTRSPPTWESPHEGGGFTDVFRVRRAGLDQPQGVYRIEGVVKFFCDTTIGVMPEPGIIGDHEWARNPEGTIGGVGISPGAPWTPNEPPWWNLGPVGLQFEGPETHTLDLEWDCCDLDSPVWRHSGTP